MTIDIWGNSSDIAKKCYRNNLKTILKIGRCYKNGMTEAIKLENSATKKG